MNITQAKNFKSAQSIISCHHFKSGEIVKVQFENTSASGTHFFLCNDVVVYPEHHLTNFSEYSVKDNKKMNTLNTIQQIASDTKARCESDIKELEKYISEKYPDMYIRITSSDTENYFSKAYHKAIKKHFEDNHGINLYSVDVPSISYHRSFENSLSNLSEKACLNYHYSKLRQDLKCSIKHFKNKIVLTTTATSFHEGELKTKPTSMLFHAFGHVINQDHSSYFDATKRNIEFFANGNRKFEISQEEAEKIQAVLDWK